MATASGSATPSPPRIRHSPSTSFNSPSMSLHHLGIISPLSPLRRQLSSPLSQRSPSLSPPNDVISVKANLDDDIDEEAEDDISEEDQDELTQDSRDVLVERLSDLVQRLSRDHSVHDGNISALHAKVDEMERVLAHGTPRSTRSLRSRPQSFVIEGRRDEQDAFWGPPMSPSWLLKRHSSDTARLEQSPEEAEGRIIMADVSPVGAALSAEMLASDEIQPRPAIKSKVSSDVVEKMVAEAEHLCQELSAVVQSLQERREESDHIHALLVERAERAAGRVVELEARVEDLEDQMQGDESELNFLRIQLKSIEVQCREYIPEEDHELVQSIKNWKEQWLGLRENWARRHQSRETSTVGTLESPDR